MQNNPGPIYRTMAKIGDDWDRLVVKAANFTARYGTILSVAFLIITAIIASIGRSVLPEMVKVELGFDGGGSTLTRNAYIIRMTLLSVMSNSIFMFLQKRTLWLVTSFSCTLAFVMIVFSHMF